MITGKTVDGDFEDYCLVNVVKPVTSISISQNEATVNKGSSLQLDVTVLPNDANNKSLQWSSDDTEVATVDSNGLVTALKPGVAVIKVETTDGSNLHAKCLLTVVQPVTDIVIEYSSLSLKIGEERPIDSYVIPEDATNKQLIWSSSDNDIASVSDGIVKGISTGEAIITVMSSDDSDISKTCAVFVDSSTGLSELNYTNNNITTFNGTIVVSGATMQSYVYIYDLYGTLVQQIYVREAKVISDKLCSGVYLVKVNGRISKIVIC